MTIKKLPQKLLYTQVVGSSVAKVLKLKENYSNLLAKKIENIQKIINDSGKFKLHIKTTTRGFFYKQIIVPIGKKNANKFMASFSSHIANINRALKNIKLDIMIDYVWPEPISITIVTSKVASPSDLQVIENFVKNIENINSEEIETSRLPQSKSYLKIISIPYFIENSNISISSDFVESVIKSNHIFNNLSLASKLQVIKALPKSNIAIVWIDIWDAQSGYKAKNIINRSFNIGSFIATIHNTNMNPGVPQYKNCWKWGYSTFLC